MMGFQLVALVLSVWAPRLDDREFRVLVRMAHTARDEPTGDMPAAHYFGGSQLLADTLAPPREGKRSPKTIKETLRLAVAELVRVGAIERVAPAYRNHNAVYRLTLEGGPIRPP